MGDVSHKFVCAGGGEYGCVWVVRCENLGLFYAEGEMNIGVL